VGAPGIVVHDLPKIFAGICPFSIFEGGSSPLEEKTVGIARIGRDGVLRTAATGHDKENQQDRRGAADGVKSVSQSSLE
jgi:hypothetical protein